MGALEGRHRAQVNPRHFRAILPFPQNAAHRRNSVLHFMKNRNCPQLLSIRNCHGDVGAPFVIHANHRRVIGVLLQEHPGLDRRVIVHAAVTVQMVRRQVGQNAHIRFQSRHQVNLKGGKLEHIDAAFHRRPHQENRGADVSAHVNIPAQCLKDMADERRGGGFAIGPGNRNNPRARARNFPLEHFRVADDFNPGGLGLHHRPVRLRMGERHTGT